MKYTSRPGRGLIPSILAASLAGSSHAAVLYTQNFDTFDDTLTSSIYFDAAPVYDGIGDALLTGANTTGNANLNGKLVQSNAGRLPQSGNYFLFTNTLGTTPQGEVWGTNNSQTVTVELGQIYEFSFYLSGANGIAPAVLSARINGVVLENLTVDGITNPGTATYSGSGPWVQYTYRWQADSTTADLSLFNLTSTATGNDFYLDTISFLSVVPEPSSTALLGVGLLGLAASRRRR